jgi:hypothetical protein
VWSCPGIRSEKADFGACFELSYWRSGEMIVSNSASKVFGVFCRYTDLAYTASWSMRYGQQ